MSILLSLLEKPFFGLLKLFKNLKNDVFDRILSRTHTCRTINLLKSDFNMIETFIGQDAA